MGYLRKTDISTFFISPLLNLTNSVLLSIASASIGLGFISKYHKTLILLASGYTSVQSSLSSSVKSIAITVPFWEPIPISWIGRKERRRKLGPTVVPAKAKQRLCDKLL